MPATPPIFLRLNDADNVIVARTDILAGTPVERVTARDPMPAGHKIATIAIAEGQPVRKYNQIIGFASQPIQPGEHVHGHNCAMADFDRDYAIGQDAREVNFLAALFDSFLEKRQFALDPCQGVVSTFSSSKGPSLHGTAQLPTR